MLLRKRLKAGILLYALFLSAIFALLLQYYIGRVQATHRVRLALQQQLEASLIAEMTRQDAHDSVGRVRFSHGQASYQRQNDLLLVTVTLSNGRLYRYEFVVPEAPSQPKEEVSPESSLPSKEEVSVPTTELGKVEAFSSRDGED